MAWTQVLYTIGCRVSVAHEFHCFRNAPTLQP
jgi:hypothetical protein